MSKELLCPFREKTSSRRLYLAIARADGPMSKSEVAKSTRIKFTT